MNIGVDVQASAARPACNTVTRVCPGISQRNQLLPRSMGMILLIFCSVCLVLPNVAQAAADPIDETLQVRSNEKIFVNVARGNVSITAVAGQSLRIQGTLDARAEDYHLVSENGFTWFEVSLPRSVNTTRQTAADQGTQLQIEVPPGSEVEFKGDSTAVNLSSITGGVKATTANGTIELQNLQGSIRAVSTGGTIQSRQNNGRLKAVTTTGTITDTGSRGSLQLATEQGRILLDSEAAEVTLATETGLIEGMLSRLQELDLDAGDGRADLQISDANAPRIHGSAYRGDIRLSLNTTINARFSLFANLGAEIVNRFTNDPIRADGFGGSQQLSFIKRRQVAQGIGVESGNGVVRAPQHLTFSLGQGEGMVDLDTVSGTLTLEAAP